MHTALQTTKNMRFKCVGSWFERRQFVTFGSFYNGSLKTKLILHEMLKDSSSLPHWKVDLSTTSNLLWKFMRRNAWATHQNCKWGDIYGWVGTLASVGFLSANFKTCTSYMTLLQHFWISWSIARSSLMTWGIQGASQEKIPFLTSQLQMFGVIYIFSFQQLKTKIF